MGLNRNNCTGDGSMCSIRTQNRPPCECMGLNRFCIKDRMKKMPKIFPFSSTSKGNCTLYIAGDKVLIIDCGVSFTRIKNALEEQGFTWSDVAGILLSHAHQDHIAALPMIEKRTTIPIYAEGRTLAAAGVEGIDHGGAPFSIEGIAITPIATCHDCAGSCGYRLEAEGRACAVVTDTGRITPAMMEHLAGCALILLESNYDPDMLTYGPYPAALKERIRSDHGHLSNEDCAAILALFAMKGDLQTAVLGHLSDHNNTPLTAKKAILDTFAQYGVEGIRLEVGGAWCPVLEI